MKARSISKAAWHRLSAGPARGAVAATFIRSCLIKLAGQDLIALVLPSIGDGPINIVVDAGPADLAPLAPGIPARWDGETLQVGPFSVGLATTPLWDPHPDWPRLRHHRRAILARIPLLLAFARLHAPEGSLLPLVWPDANDLETSQKPLSAVLAAARQAAQHLRAAWSPCSEGFSPSDPRSEGFSPSSLRHAATHLAGLGGGLTPAGDDFLTGIMLWAWLAEPSPEAICAPLLEGAQGRTTALSSAFLRAAAAGECAAPWHLLLDALAGGTDAQLETATREVLAHGHTSGADTLAGFLLVGGNNSG